MGGARFRPGRAGVGARVVPPSKGRARQARAGAVQGEKRCTQ